MKKAKYITVAEKVHDRGKSFIVKEILAGQDWIAFIDTDGVYHGAYHPDEYLGVGE